MDESGNDTTGKRTHKPVAPDVANRRRRRQLAIAATLRAARRARHLNQTELADAAGISHGHLGRLESTRGATTYDMTLLRFWDILDALGMTWADWEREVRTAMAGGALPPPSRRDEQVALLARIVRTLPDDSVELLVDFARTMERHLAGFANMPADAIWVREADAAARRAGLEALDEELGLDEAGAPRRRRKDQQQDQQQDRATGA